jgi:hypothetical protein
MNWIIFREEQSIRIDGNKSRHEISRRNIVFLQLTGHTKRKYGSVKAGLKRGMLYETNAKYGYRLYVPFLV